MNNNNQKQIHLIEEEQKINNFNTSGSKVSHIRVDEDMKKSGVKASFERGQLSQMRLFESFKSRNQFDKEESIEECDTFTNNDRIKKPYLDGSDNNQQFDLQLRNQLKFPFSLQQFQVDSDSMAANSVSGVGNKIKKMPTPGMSSIGGDMDQQDKDGDGQFSHLNDSKMLSRKDQVVEKIGSGGVDDGNNSKNVINIGEKSPLAKNMLYSRRGSRRIPGGGMNISGVYGKDSNALNTQTHNNLGNEQKQPIVAHKSGFFFALKMKKYANHLVSRLQSRRYAGLRQRHLQFFNDKTILPNEEIGAFKNANHGEDPDEYEVQSSINIKNKFVFILKEFYQKYFSAKLKQYVSHLPMFQPSHTAKLIWDSLNMISISYFLIFFPLRIAFGLDINESAASFVALGIISFDILVYLNTGFYDKGTLVTDRIGILIHYIDNRFFSDILSMIPFMFYNFSNADQNVFNDRIKFIESVISLFFLVRVTYLGQIKKKIEERFYQNKTLTHIISLFTLLSMTLYIAHIFSCIWIIVAQYKQESQDTWMQYAKVADDDWIVKYLYSLYFLIITMTTVGYGDIKPQNNIEHLFIIIIVLISSGVFSFSINKIGTIVQQMSEEKEKVKETLQVINNYMNKKNINMNLQQQIREYLEYYLKESLMNDNETEDKIIDMLSEPLKRSLMIEANKIALKDSPIFRNNFSEATISKTVSLIQELRCTPEEVIFYEGDIDSSAIFFVQQGKVELFIDSYKSTGETEITSLKIFQQGSSFGETSFFTGGSRGISIRSIDFTTLLMIKRQDFLNVVKESSEDYEIYCKIRDKILFYKNFDDLGIKCISCNSRNHFLNDCPFIHFVSDKEKIIKIDQRPVFAERCEFDQPRLQKFNVFDNIETIQIAQLEFTEEKDIQSYLDRQDWFDRNAEDEEEYEFYNQYEGEDEEDEEGLRDLEGGVADNNIKYYYKYDGNNPPPPHDQFQHQTSLTHPSPYKDEVYATQQTGERMSYRKEDANFLVSNPNQAAGETHSHKSGYKQLNNLDVEEKRERSASNLGLNELTLTPSGLVLNLINPNPGNVRESSQKLQKRKRSASNSNLNNTPQILYKSHTLQNDDQGLLPVQSSNFNISTSAMLPTPQLNPLANTPMQYSINNPNNNNNPSINPPGNYSIKQASLGRANSLVKRGTKRKNTEKTLRSTNKRKSTKRTIDSKMNVQVGTNSYQNERKPMKKLTAIRKGFQENQIQNTLLALQGMENILLQNKSNTNSNEFDVMKSYEFYFPHNNIDIVIFQLRKKNPHLYTKAKSFVKSTTKKLFGAMTMNSQHNRMSKMDIVLSKFLMQEADEEKDKDSLHSNRLKSFTYNTHKTDHYKTPKTSYANNEYNQQKYKNQEKKRSFNVSNNDVIDQLQESPLMMRAKCKSMKVSNHNRETSSHFQIQNMDDDSQNQPSLHNDEIYLDGFDHKQTITHIQASQQNSIISSKANSNNHILPVEDASPKKNVSFQDNLQESHINI